MLLLFFSFFTRSLNDDNFHRPVLNHCDCTIFIWREIEMIIASFLSIFIYLFFYSFALIVCPVLLFGKHVFNEGFSFAATMTTATRVASWEGLQWTFTPQLVSLSRIRCYQNLLINCSHLEQFPCILLGWSWDVLNSRIAAEDGFMAIMDILWVFQPSSCWPWHSAFGSTVKWLVTKEVAVYLKGSLVKVFDGLSPSSGFRFQSRCTQWQDALSEVIQTGL